MLALLLGTVAGIAQARLGETEKQCGERYGLPTALGPTPGSDKTVSYEKDGLKIYCEFVKGKCLRITYQAYLAFSDKLWQSRLDLAFQSEGGSVWANYPGGKPNEYVRSDRLANALKNWNTITFTLNDWDKLHDQAVKDQESAKKAAEKTSTHSQLKKLGSEL